MKRVLSALLMMGLLIACINEETPGNEGGNTIDLQGTAQKGQLVKGSVVTAYALNDKLYSLGSSYPSAISDDLGSFKVSAVTEANYLELRAEGYYFVENTGGIASNPIYLQAIVESRDSNANINVLTTLIVPRIKYLVSTGESFPEAKERAQNEILTALSLGYYTQTATDFDVLDISKDSDANALLLAISCLLQAGRKTGEVTELIAEISSSFEKTGIVSSNLINKLYANRRKIDILSIINNLKEFYNRKDLSNYSIPAFFKYIDNAYDNAFVVLNPKDFRNPESGIYSAQNLSQYGANIDLYFLSPSNVQIRQVDDSGNAHTYKWINCTIEPYEQIAWVAHFKIDENSGHRRRAYIDFLDDEGKVVLSMFFDQDMDRTKDTSSSLRTEDAVGIEAACAMLQASLNLNGVQYDDIEFGFNWGDSESSLGNEVRSTEILNDVFSYRLEGLRHKTQYWYRAYVKLDGHTFYGGVKTFTTSVVPVESVSIDREDYSFTEIGKSVTLNATVLPADATNKAVEWSSSDDKVISVNSKGLVKAIGNGTATITVTTKDQGKTASCNITVAQRVTSITLNKTSLSLIIGEEATISVTSVLPDNANDKTYTWSSSDNSIATVDQNGIITAKARGKTDIKATANDGSEVFASCAVGVKGPCPTGAVDLGLSIHWATCNLSESGFVRSPQAYGDYYAWGEVETYYTSRDPLTWKDGKTGHNWDSYKWCEGSNLLITKYKYYGEITVLEESDDVAHAKLGGRWRMPTYAEWEELLMQCSWAWTSDYNGTGISGMIGTSNIDGYKDKSIFLPAAGFWPYYADFPQTGSQGLYWSSSLKSGLDPHLESDSSFSAWAAYFSSNENDVRMSRAYFRYEGLSVRAVSD